MQKYLFEISGKVSGDLKDQSNPEKPNTRDDLVLDHLNNLDLSGQIQQELLRKFSQTQYAKVDEVHVDLQFGKGSIIAVGLIIVDVMEGTVAVVEFTKYATLMIKMVTERLIRQSIPRKRLPNYEPFIQVTPASTPEETSADSIFDGLPFKIVKWLTIVNVIFFVGGTVVTGVTIKSVLEKF
jgi:hypothetical protein